MKSRNEAIKRVKGILQEDITDSFHISEVDAALEGEMIFSVTNSTGEQVTMKNNFQPYSETLHYDMISYTLLMLPEKRQEPRLCHHSIIRNHLHDTQYTCMRCGLIADVEYFTNKRER